MKEEEKARGKGEDSALQWDALMVVL